MPEHQPAFFRSQFCQMESPAPAASGEEKIVEEVRGYVEKLAKNLAELLELVEQSAEMRGRARDVLGAKWPEVVAKLWSEAWAMTSPAERRELMERGTRHMMELAERRDFDGIWQLLRTPAAPLVPVHFAGNLFR